jgi:hypothetical protein
MIQPPQTTTFYLLFQIAAQTIQLQNIQFK